MSFFQSDVVRAEMVEISELQEEVYSNVFKFPSMAKEDQHHHVDILESASMMGIPSHVDMGSIFNQMSDMVGVLKTQLDKNQFSL